MLMGQVRTLDAGSVQTAATRSLATGRSLRFPRSHALALALAILLAAVACSRKEGVELSGSVYDPTGSRIPHALVFIADPEQNVTEAVTAGPDGSFRIKGLSPSPSYEIEVRGPSGFEPRVQSLDLSDDRHLDFELDIEPIVEELVISGTRPQPESGGSGEPRRRVRVGGNVRRARLVHYVPPTFPENAEFQGIGGTVLLEGVIGKEGRLVGLSELNSIIDERLVDAASDAVLQWRYDPTLLNGQPVETVVTISVAFEIP